jgi:protein-serine/threonine kinase
VRLADFGLSKEGVKDNDTAMSFCGTPAYLAPEMIKHKGSPIILRDIRKSSFFI